MTVYEWVMIGLTAAGFITTWGGFVLGFFRGIEKIKGDITHTNLEVVQRILTVETVLRREIDDRCRQQDHNYGEVSSSLRRYIETVEKTVQQIELWNRDHFVQKTDFQRAFDALTDSLHEGFNEIRNELHAYRKELKDDINRKNGTKTT